jgi:hypothetical protein
VDPDVVQSENVHRVIQAAAKFASELRAAGHGAELDKREVEYQRLTGPESAFGVALTSVRDALKRASADGWVIAESTALYPRRQIVINDVEPDERLGGDAVPRIIERLTNETQILWGLGQAEAEAKLVLRHASKQDVTGATQVWLTELQNLRVAELRDHFRGAHLLSLCERAVFGVRVEPAGGGLAGLLTSDWQTCMEYTRSAAAYIFATVLQSPLSQRQSEAHVAPAVQEADGAREPLPTHQDVREGTGFHGPNEAPPANYKYGPLAAAFLKDLAAAICPGLNLEPDPRNLRKIKVIWVKRLNARSYQVYFADHERYLNAEALYQKVVKEAQSRKQTKKAEKKAGDGKK